MSCRALFCLLLGAVSLPAEWMAGAAKVSITPREPVWLAGYANRDRPHEKVIQEIWVKALALRDGSGATSVIVTSDLVGLSVSMVEEIRRRALRASGVAAERLILNYSHNHSAPVTGDVLHLYYDLDARQKAAVERYTRALLERCQRAIAEAVRNLAPATLAFEQGLAGFAVNRRRSRPGGRALDGPVDHDVPVLAVRAPDGRLRAALFGYACHNTALGRYEVSGDYAGYAQQELEKKWPGAVALFLMGAGGDANPLPRYQGADPAMGSLATELASMYGRILAAAVDLVLRGKMRPVRGLLRTGLANATAPFAQAPTAAQLRAQLAEAREPMRRREIRHLLGVLERGGRLPESYPYPVQVWQFGGDLKLIALTGEPVVDYALRFKKRYGPDSTWVAGYTNELLAYIPSLRVLREGGYEGAEGMAEYGLAAPFAEGIEEAIASTVEELAAPAAGAGSPGGG